MKLQDSIPGGTELSNGHLRYAGNNGLLFPNIDNNNGSVKDVQLLNGSNTKHINETNGPESVKLLNENNIVQKEKIASNCGLILFVANAGGLVILFMTMMIYSGGVVRTVERRFSLRSQQTGILSSLNDITHICLVMFIGYFARKANKPRIIAVTILFSAVGGYLFALPHFLTFPSHDHPQDVQSSSSFLNATVSRSKLVQLCDAGSNKTFDDCPSINADGTSASLGVHPAYSFFFASQLISGVGSSGVFTLTLAYIDENAPTSKAALFIGVLSSLYAFGPLCGFMLAGLTLRLPENLLDASPVGPDHPTWIGNWWLGYVICSTGLILLSIPMWFFPTRLSSAPPKDESKTTGQQREVQGFGQQIKEFPRDLMHLLKNRMYMINLIPIISGAYIINGIFAQVVRYVEVHFMEPAFVASIIAALVLAFAGGVGSLIGGIVMNRCKLTPVGAMKMWIFSTVSFATGIIIILNLGCPQTPIAGNVDLDTGLVSVANTCNAGCGCGTSRQSYAPVCGSDNLTYFSSCFAGCTSYENQTYSGCTCTVDSGIAHPGLCKIKCHLLIPFAATLFCMSLVGSLARVPATMVNLRIVDDDERAFALGINSFAINLLGFIPGPILFGTLIDSACKLWQTTCNKTGACLIFDTAKFRKLTYGVSLGFQLLDLIFVVILFFLVRRSKIVFRSAAGTTAEVTRGKSWDSMAPDKSCRTKSNSIDNAEKELVIKVTQL